MFPESPRVIYEKNPLATVICQLRFAPILRIDADPPAEFQERIRQTYPLLREKSPETSIDLPSDLPEGIANLVRASIPTQLKQRAYDFISADETWTVGLTRDFLALSTTKYRRWEEFRDQLAEALEAFQQTYSPAFFTRIGLRYQDLIQRSKLNLGETQWSDLLKPQIAGVLSSLEIAPSLEESLTQLLIQFPDDSGKVRIKHGLVQTPDTNNEECYLIDSDFFTDQRIETKDASNRLDYFNRQSGRLFRWCVQDRLHEAMGPQAIEPPR